MKVIRIEGPAALMTPSELPGAFSDDDKIVMSLIGAVQANIDGPSGWVGRSFGAQKLKLLSCGFRATIELPYGPVSSVTSVKFLAEDGEENEVDEADYRLASGDVLVFRTGFQFPTTTCAVDALRVEYEAEATDDGHIDLAKTAITLGVQQLKPLGERDLQLRSEDVEGVGSRSYTVSDASASLIKRATETLLWPLKVMSV